MGLWYIESGQGMGATLGIARERNGYVITDRATYLALSKNLGLPILVQGDRALLNIYSVLEVNPANGRVNVAGGKAFADFMVAPSTQKMIQGLVSISSASIRASDVGIAAIIPENPGSLKFAGKIREVFCAQKTAIWLSIAQAFL
jgi:ABC-type tungstate transport system permease subunit